MVSRGRFIPGWMLVGAALWAGGCAPDVTAPRARDADRVVGPQLARTRSDAPALTATTVTFWVSSGRPSEGALYFAGRHGADSSELARLQVPAGAVIALPDGTPLARTDSVRITMTASDPEHLIVSFEPSGLRFDSRHPARLTMRYDQAAARSRGSGRDGAGTTVAAIAIWKREQPSDPWQRVGGRNDAAGHRIDTDIMGFTDYAVSF